jgi:hypothetical protein
MSYYVVESYDFAVDHGGRASRGVVGDYKGSEKIYLHVLPLTDAEITKLSPRVDEDGNLQHARLALPRDEVFWIGVDGEVAWPGIHRPRITSRCDLVDDRPRPVALSADDLGRLRKAGVPGV